MTAPFNSQTQASLSRQERDTLVLSQLTEVRFIAQRIHRRLPAFVPLDDLVHSGVLGLMEAAHKYDSTKNIQFKTFAQFRIGVQSSTAFANSTAHRGESAPRAGC